MLKPSIWENAVKKIICLLIMILHSTGASAGEEKHNPDPIDVRQIVNPPVLDGRLDDSQWADATRISDFVQRFPKDGNLPTEKTDVFFIYTSSDLFVGVRCYDAQPAKIIATVMQRDNFDLLQNDQFVVAIDSYNDGRNGYWFSTNALGVRADCLFIDEGETWICEWDGIWECASQIDSLGWTAEMRIPFSTLRFDGAVKNVMGINLFRRLIRSNEEIYSPHIPLQYPHGTADVSIARKFRFDGISGGSNLYVQPYVLGGRQWVGTGGNQKVTTKGEFGGDVRYDITDYLTSNLTYNTDFAQVELDDRQINLTRFSLFFPEKRDFFLESAGLFSFGTPREVEVFYSRKIGLTGDSTGRMVEEPILAGGKLYGRSGNFEFGLMDVQTRPDDGATGKNFSASRFKYQVLKRSYVGFIATNRFSEESADNTALGLDANILVSDDLGFSGFISTTRTSGDRFGERSSSAFNLNLFKRGERSSFGLGFTEVGRDFNPEIGFLRRSGFRKLNGNARTPWFVESESIRRLVPEYTGEYFFNLDGKIESSVHKFRLQAELQSNDVLEAFVRREFDFVPAIFPVFRSREVPAGEYDAYVGGMSLQSKQGRKLSTALAVEHGGFFGGMRTSLRTSVQWKANRHVTVFQDYETARIDLDASVFVIHIAQTRLNFALNTKLFLNTLIQYDNESRELGMNLRLNYQIREGRELFVVYNDVFDGNGPNSFPKSQVRSILLKINYLFEL